MLSRLLTIREQIILAALALSIVLGAGTLFLRGASDTASPVTTPETIAATSETPQSPTENPVPETPPAPREAQKTTGEAASTPDMAQKPMPETTPTTSPPAEPQAPPMPDKIGVAIMGAVHSPGFYWMKPGQRVIDLVEQAGGFLASAEVLPINQAAHLIDGTTLTIPTLPEQEIANGVLRMRREHDASPLSTPINPAAYMLSGIGVENIETVAAQTANVSAPQINTSSEAARPSPQSASSRAGYIALNHATQAELETLPGIGTALAERIIQYRNQRPFQRVEELQEVSGIGPKRFEAVRDRLTLY